MTQVRPPPAAMAYPLDTPNDASRGLDATAPALRLRLGVLTWQSPELVGFSACRSPHMQLSFLRCGSTAGSWPDGGRRAPATPGVLQSLSQ